MALAKNFSDETGKGGNPGRFTPHLEQVERDPSRRLAALNSKALPKAPSLRQQMGGVAAGVGRVV